MKKISIIAFLFFCVVISAFSSNHKELLDTAKNLYSKGNFENAISIYKKINSEGFEAPELYFNLGNCYYKTGKNGYAILNYERALKLSPSDEDIKYNLKLANFKIKDKTDTIPQLFIHEWKDGFVNSLNEKEWSILNISIFGISLLFIVLYFIATTITRKQLMFWLAVTSLILFTITFFTAKTSKKKSYEDSKAIIISPSATGKSAPTEQATDLFTIHDGLKVSVEQTENDWIEIKIPNGNVGWIKTSEVEVI
jgi:tetratricopeptide (TPR) repeat protein